MAYDGSIKFDTSIDTNGFTSGLSRMKSLAKSSMSVISSAVGLVTTGLIAAGTAAVNTGTEFESAFAGVVKTVDATDEELSTLKQGLIAMSKEIPQSASELAGIAEAAGQLGIETENIKDFTEVMANLGVATNMGSEEAATQLARLANITGMSQTDFDKLGSAIVALGNNLATTESEIVAMSLRIAGAGNQVGMTEEQITAFSGALSSVGIEAEMGGSAFSTLISKMNLATSQYDESKRKIDSTGRSLQDLQLFAEEDAKGFKEFAASLGFTSKELKSAMKNVANLNNFSEVAGVTSQEFKKAFETDASSAIVSFLKGLDNINKNGGSAISTLDNMGLSETRIRDTLLRASAAGDTFTKSLEISSAAWEENTALINEAERRYETLESKIQLMKNSLSALGIAFKDSIDDKLRSAVETGTGYIDRLSDAFTDGGLDGAVKEAGNIFGELSVKIAGYAPDMIEAAVSFIKSFVQGINNNKEQVLSAVKEVIDIIGGTLLELLPETIQYPVKNVVGNLESTLSSVVDVFTNIFDSRDIKDAIGGIVSLIGNFADIILDIVKDVLPDFQTALLILRDAFNSNGFRRGVQAARDIFKRFGDIVSNVAKAVLPFAAQILGTIAEHLDILVPLAEAAVVAFTAWKIISSVVKWGNSLSKTLAELTAKVVAQSSAQVVAALQTGGTTTAMTLQQIAAGVLTGKIGITTAATWLWNAAQEALNKAMSANPIGLVVTAIAVLATAIVGITNLIVQANDRTEECAEAVSRMRDSQQAAKESSENLGTAINNVSEYMADFHNGVKNAVSVLDNVDDSIIMNTKKFDSLSEEMETVQSEFTDIAGTYSEERKKLTESEIAELKDLLKQMQKLADQQLEMLKGYQNVAQTKTKKFVDSFSGTAEEFAEESKSYIKAANEARDKVVDAADKQYNTALLNIQKMTGLSEKERKRLEDEAKKQYDNAVAAANKERDATVAIVGDKYNKLETVQSDFNLKIIKLNNDLYAANEEMAKKTTENAKKYADDYDRLTIEQAKKTKEYNNKVKQLTDDFLDDFGEDTQEGLAIWIQTVAETQGTNGELEESTALMCTCMLNELEALPPDAKAAMKDTINKLHTVIDKLPEDMKRKAENSVDAFADTLSSNESEAKVEEASQKVKDAAVAPFANISNDGEKIGENLISGVLIGVNGNAPKLYGAFNNFDMRIIDTIESDMGIASPSKVMKKLFGYVIEGCILGITDNQKDLLKSAADLAGNVTKCIGGGIGDSVMTARVSLESNTDSLIDNIKDKLKNSNFTAQLKSAVIMESSNISSVMAGRNTNRYEKSDNGSDRTVKASGNIETHINIDGREFAVAVVPYVDEELAFTKG